MATPSSTPETATTMDWRAGELVLERTFPAPRAQVFAAWTEAERFARWFGPNGSRLEPCRLDARPGGTLHYRHRFDDHDDVWVKGTYLEVRPPERLAFTCHFSDEEGARRDRPGFPAEMRIEVDFAEEGEGTRLFIRHVGLDADRGEVQGWTESLDRLAAELGAA